MNTGPAQGARPPDAARGEDASRWVRRMFGSVAGRYDLLNHLLSINLDRAWRRRTAACVRPVLSRPGARVLDLCCGTGDLMLALQAVAGGPVLGCDFSRPMLEIARRKLLAAERPFGLLEADALHLPVRDSSFDLVTIAFGFRNLASYQAGLEEMARILRPGGMVAILEFSAPSNRVFAAVYRGYSRWVLPAVGRAVSGSREAYAYLPESVRRFPGRKELAERMECAGFRDVTCRTMTGGVVALHTGTR
jgi:demethylmenaquinone methyltransferase / 2-methoxy-6-polyprenyl-1,4-benzoquinol methylase